jgi:hypothetical protein
MIATLLAILLWVLGAVVALLVALLVLLLVVPTQLWVAGDVSFERLAGEARARWGFGLVTVRVSSVRGAELWLAGRHVKRFEFRDEDEERRAEKKKKKQEKKKRKAEKKKDKGEEERFGFAWFRSHSRTMMRLSKRTVAAFEPRLRVAGVVGLGDPADTAVFFEAVRQVQMHTPEAIDIALESEWVDEELDLEIRFIALIWPLKLLVVFLAMLVEADTRRMLRAAA